MTFLALVLLACAKADSGATTVLVDELALAVSNACRMTSVAGRG